jgi:hypothetical protein
VTGDVDLDRLADYIGGALDGTPDEAAVAQLVATDPQWTRTHAALLAADAFVRADLAVLAGEPEPMPDEVVVRLSAALAAEPPLPGTAAADSRPRLSVLPGGRAAPTPSATRGRRRTVIGVAAAASVLGLGAVGLTPTLRGSGAGDAKTAATDLGARAPTPSPSSVGPASGQAATDVHASGSDYTADTLAVLGGASIAARGDNSTKTESRPDAPDASSQSTGRPTEVPDPLRRLAEPDARAACLKAIVAQYGGTAMLLDYARYQGSPALIVLLDGAQGVVGRKWVVAVGPKCGAGGAIADQRFSAQVG